MRFKFKVKYLEMIDVECIRVSYFFFKVGCFD